MGTPSTTAGPGFGAFLAFFVLAVVLWLLMRNMNARMRRMAYREQERLAALEATEQAGREERARAASAGVDTVAADDGPERGGDEGRQAKRGDGEGAQAEGPAAP